MSLSVRALSVGRLVGVPKPIVTFMRGWTETYDLSVLMFVIEGGPAPIVVDTGPPDADRARRYHGYQLDQRPDERPEAQLAAAGIDPADVAVVVHTHLHWDHCSNETLFPRARFVVQRAELHYALHPTQWHRAAFECMTEIQAPWAAVKDQLEVVDGDGEICDGVNYVSLAGHTPGSQGVLVRTAGGPVLIAGDTVDTYQNWAGDESASHIPSGLYTDLLAYEATFQKIEALGCEVVPSHDREVLNREPFR